MLSFNKMITCSSMQRNANVGQKKSLKLQTKKCFVLLRGFFGVFFCILCQAGRDTKTLKQQEEEEKQKPNSHSMLTVFLK